MMLIKNGLKVTVGSLKSIIKRKSELENLCGDGFDMNSENNFEELLNKYKIPVIVGLVGLVLLIGGVISSGIIPKTFVKSSKRLSAPTAASEVSGVNKILEVKVDVSGAVVSPGVYSLPNDARVEDALKQAGGVTQAADPAYVAKAINLAQKVADGMKIYVPQASEVPQMGASLVQGTSTSMLNEQTLININTASLADLDKLSGVGAVTAQKIIDNRPYSGIEDLVIKKAVSRSVYEKIKGEITTW